jgi:hypothetical protein
LEGPINISQNPAEPNIGISGRDHSGRETLWQVFT